MSRLAGYRTLMLDSGYRPLRTFSWKRAVILDLQERIDVLEYYDEVIRTPSAELPLPSVIRLRQYLRYRPYRVSFSRKNVFLRDGHQCQYCGRHPSLRDLTMDHVMPSSRGGPTTWENIVTACGPCNRRKGNRTPREARMPLMSTPVQPKALPRTSGVGGLVEIPETWKEYLPLASGE